MAICPICRSSGNLGEECPQDHVIYIDESEVQRAPSDSLLGYTVGGRFTAHGLVGEGGMGVIYRAKQKMVGRNVALKVLKREFMEDELVRDRFLREAEVVATLSHRNIVTLYDAGIDLNLGVMYMAMELLEGETLFRRLRHLPDIDSLISFFLGISSALSEAHNKGIVHRDLKPENIFIVKDETGVEIPKVLDFGFARLQNASKKLTLAGTAFGTPHYMSPEQAMGLDTIKPAADVYALGVMLYEAISGDVPYDGSNPIAVMTQQVNSPVPRCKPKAEFAKLVPDTLVDLIYQCMQKEPEERPSDGGKVYAALLDIQTYINNNVNAFLGETQAMVTPDEEAIEKYQQSKQTPVAPKPEPKPASTLAVTEPVQKSGLKTFVKNYLALIIILLVLIILLIVLLFMFVL